MSGKSQIVFILNGIQVQGRATHIKRLRWIVEKFFHHAPVTAGKDEPGVLAFLDIGTQQFQHVIIRILRDLLELIHRHKTGDLAAFQVLEDFLQGIDRLDDFSEREVENELAGYRIHLESGPQGFYNAQERLQ